MYTKVSSEYAFDAHPTRLVYIVNIFPNFNFSKTLVSWLTRSLFFGKKEVEAFRVSSISALIQMIFEVRFQKSTFHKSTSERKCYIKVNLRWTQLSEWEVLNLVIGLFRLEPLS